jgi:hypothetical protein
MTTKLAFFASMSATQWLRPYFAKSGFLESLVVDLSPSAVLASASLRRRAFFSCLDLVVVCARAVGQCLVCDNPSEVNDSTHSGLYLFKSWKS